MGDGRQRYAELLRYARRVSRRADEAEDLVQTVLVAALEAGRADLGSTANRRWLHGALKKRAAFEARSALRRRRREMATELAVKSTDDSLEDTLAFANSLPRRLRTTALLALSGHTRTEMRWLLKINDAALRQRLKAIRSRWNATGNSGVPQMASLKGDLPFGAIRQALLPVAPRQKVFLASHDPDGHIFALKGQG